MEHEGGIYHQTSGFVPPPHFRAPFNTVFPELLSILPPLS